MRKLICKLLEHRWHSWRRERLEALVEEVAGIRLALVNRSVPPGEGREGS